MYNRRRYIVKKIKIHLRVRKYLTILCIMLIASGISSFFLFGFYANSNTVKFITKYKDKKNLKIEKVMTNPRIKFEYDKNSYYAVTAQKAIHEDDDNILLFNVQADGSSVNIKAGKLSIKNNGNDLTFTDNPVLIIKKNPNKS